MPDRRAIALTLAFFSVIGAASGEDRVEARVDQVHLRLLAHEPKIEAAEVRLKDGTEIAGKYVTAERRGLRLIPKPGASANQLIPYEQITTIRLDLGRNRAYRIVVGVLGAVYIGGPIGFAASYNLDATAGSVAMLASVAAGGYLGQKLGGVRHRWLTIVVR